MARPFLKWVGGKRQLLSALSPLLPKALSAGRAATYVEPFLGGGAMFFHLAEAGLVREKPVLRDANPELILVYRVVQRKVELLIKTLSRLETAHLKLTPEKRREHYLKQRQGFNENRIGFSFRNLTEASILRAAQFLFLNRTGYNGLWRVNSEGGFNVPFGRYREPRICDADRLREASSVLRALKAEIQCGDFAGIEDCAGEGTFIYYDPPYRPVSRSATFTTYTAGGFHEEQQQSLAQLFRSLSAKGAWQMMSNSDAGDGYFQKLYRGEGLTCHRVQARRSINSRASARGAVSEIVVVNYPV